MSNLNRYVDPSFVYNFAMGPDMIRTIDDARQLGINCVSLAHLALKDLFEFDVPATLNCFELFIDRQFFDEVESTDNLRAGDLVWFGHMKPRVPIDKFVPEYNGLGQLLNWPDCPVKHVGIATGSEQRAEPAVLHSTHIEGTNVLWPLSAFAGYRRYQKVYGITRLKDTITERTVA